MDHPSKRFCVRSNLEFSFTRKSPFRLDGIDERVRAKRWKNGFSIFWKLTNKSFTRITFILNNIIMSLQTNIFFKKTSIVNVLALSPPTQNYIEQAHPSCPSTSTVISHPVVDSPPVSLTASPQQDIDELLQKIREDMNVMQECIQKMRHLYPPK